MLDNLSLKLKVGKTIAIVGPSGSGKSTLLNLILRLYVPDEGKLTIDGVDIRKVTRESLRSSMAVVFQENMLFNMSIRENIRLGKEGATDEEVEQAARKAEIHRHIMSLPEKYDTSVGERGDTLSGGQRQRIAIARAIVRDPSVLLLDEATSALDQTTEAAINATLLKLAKGRTMIFSTHRLTSVVEMDEIIVIAGGRAIERGSHADLLALGGAYRKLWDDQGLQPHAAVDEDDDDDDETTRSDQAAFASAFDFAEASIVSLPTTRSCAARRARETKDALLRSLRRGRVILPNTFVILLCFRQPSEPSQRLGHLHPAARRR